MTKTTKTTKTPTTMQRVRGALRTAGFSEYSWSKQAPHHTRGFTIGQHDNVIVVVYTGNQNGQPRRYATALKQAGMPCTFFAVGVRIEK